MNRGRVDGKIKSRLSDGNIYSVHKRWKHDAEMKQKQKQADELKNWKMDEEEVPRSFTAS